MDVGGLSAINVEACGIWQLMLYDCCIYVQDIVHVHIEVHDKHA